MKTKSAARFKIQPFINKLTGSQSWRVSGTRRNGERVRENYSRENDARCRQTELEAEYLQGQSEIMLRSTKLTEPQIRVAESIFTLLPDAEQVRDRFMRFLQNGAATTPTAHGQAPLIDEAFKQFENWLDGNPDSTGNNICDLSEPSRLALRSRVGAFKSAMGRVRLDKITVDMIESFLGNLKAQGKKLHQRTVINYKLNISRFFTWCIARPRQWVTLNPCSAIRLDQPKNGPPKILTVEQAEKLLKAAEKCKLAVYTALGLFGGLRPTEIQRISWKQVNLIDEEIRIEDEQTKTTVRVMKICPTLLTWLKAYKDEEIYPPNWKKRFRKVHTEAGIAKWIPDVMRHTAISHFCRRSKSYIEVEEQFGNSEAVIKENYKARVSSDETKKFYDLKPATK